MKYSMDGSFDLWCQIVTCMSVCVFILLFIKNLYASMDEPDGVTGAAAIRK